MLPVDEVTSDMDEATLAGLYRWLARHFPPAEDVRTAGGSFTTPEQQVHHWRSLALRVLGGMGTAESVVRIAGLRHDFPGDLSIAAALISARRSVQASSWVSAQSAELIAMFGDSRRRFVRTPHERAAVIVKELDRIRSDIAGHGELLWDRVPGTRKRAKKNMQLGESGGDRDELIEQWSPKPEAALSAYLAHEFNLRLSGHRVIVNREVLIQPTDAYGAGDRTDILIQANVNDGDFAGIGTGPEGGS